MNELGVPLVFFKGDVELLAPSVRGRGVLPRLRGQVALPPRALRRRPGWLSWRACWRGLAIEAFAGVLPCLAPAPPPSGQAALVDFARPTCNEVLRWRGEWAVVGERAATDLRPSGAAVPP